ncbi:hypothetical protein SC936_05205 [Aggregatibacter actinomycetemcomitans serotype e str. SC936]|nr:hypothetical protein SA3096_04250 [Aggregatibacter actinomycetemcomitans serotype e str. SA3096]KYK81078.1 hypothetical protein SC936_05205 [Aggregatibacter actinomycetemcomitans serotype e str. SC936]KYK95901.1 hypothetical protein ANH9776_02900 [Aggregatibacter actinomycetemcomitans serotype e str. ANH9776]
MTALLKVRLFFATFITGELMIFYHKALQMPFRSL